MVILVVFEIYDYDTYGYDKEKDEIVKVEETFDILWIARVWWYQGYSVMFV